MPACRALDDEESEACAFDALGEWPGNPVEPAEDSFGFERWQAWTVVAHLKERTVAVSSHVHLDVDLIAGELHRIVEQVDDGAAKLLPVAHDVDGGGIRRKAHGRLGQMTARSREGHTLLREAEQVVPFRAKGRATGLAGPEHLFDRLGARGVLEHDAVKLTAPRVINRLRGR